MGALRRASAKISASVSFDLKLKNDSSHFPAISSLQDMSYLISIFAFHQKGKADCFGSFNFAFHIFIYRRYEILQDP